MRAEHKQLESNNGCVHYWISKNSNPDAKCILFTHGLTANHTMFEKQVEYFKDNYSVITWDVPLHGLSRPYQNFSYENTAKELNSILNKENIQKVILVGMSMGGYPCQEFAYRYPENIDRMIMLDTTPFGLAYYSKSDLWWLKQVAPLGKFAKENKNMQFDFPVLLLLGDHDTTGKVKQYNKAWAKETGYPLHIIKHAAHFSNGDNPEQVNQEIENFIQENNSYDL